MSDKQRLNALEWVVVVIGTIALISFLFVILVGDNVGDLTNRVATLEATP